MLNRIVLMGRLTRDPELRFTENTVPCASFSLAVERDFSDRSSGQKQTDFIDCVAWRKPAEFVTKYLKKGSMAIVSGRLQIRTWQDKDGNNRRTAEVIADSIYFGESKKADAPAPDLTSQSNPTFQDPGPYAETERLIKQYQQQGFPSDYAMLEDPDSQLPF